MPVTATGAAVAANAGAATIRGDAIIAAVKASGIATIVSVPDIVTSEHVLWPIARDLSLRLIRVCKEDEGVSICAGLAYTGTPSLLLIQHTGLLDSVNAIRAIGVEYRFGLCMIVGLQGMEPDRDPPQSGKYGVRIVEPLLDVMGVGHARDRHAVRVRRHPQPGVGPMPMRRDECLKILARHHTDEIVVPVYQAAFEWRTIKPQALTYLGVGAMGQASSHALGFALGRPDKRVLVLDGDGSLLMNLGSLVTIATVAPKNLVHFVCQNDNYEANGGHPIPGAGRVSFAGFARAAGYRAVHEFDALDAFAARIGAVLNEEGPVFVVLQVVAGEPYPQDFPALHDASLREAFRAALAAS